MQIKEEDLSVTQLIFLKYIEWERVDATAKYIRNTGKKMPNGNSVQPSHVSATLDSSPKEVPNGVQNIAKSIFKKNRSLAYRISS